MINSKVTQTRDGYTCYSHWFDGTKDNYTATVTHPKWHWLCVTETAPTELGAVRKALKAARKN